MLSRPPSYGVPSRTMRGDVPALIEDIPRMSTEGEELPGAPELELIWTPETLPLSASTGLVT